MQLNFQFLRVKIHSLCGYLSQCLTAFCEPSLLPRSARPCLPAAGHHWLLSCYLCPKLHLYEPCLGCGWLLWDASFPLFSPSLTNPDPSVFPAASLAANTGALWAVPPSGAARWVFSPCCCKGAHLFILLPTTMPRTLLAEPPPYQWLPLPALVCLKKFTNRPAMVVSAQFLEGPHGCL